MGSVFYGQYTNSRRLAAERRRDPELDEYLRSLPKADPLNAEQEQLLATRRVSGDRSAREKLITSNLSLVITIASQFAGYDLPLVDVIGAGNLGLIAAVDHYEPGRDGRFATFAQPAIRRACRRAIAKASGLPEYLHGDMVRVGYLERTTDLGDEELATTAKIPTARLQRIKNLPEKVLSLDAPLHGKDGAECDYTLADTIADTRHEDAASQTAREEQMDAIPRIMAQRLTQRERLVLSCRYGLGELEGKVMTRAQTAEMLARIAPPRVSLSTISRLERRALEKLREGFASPEPIDIRLFLRAKAG